MSRFAARQTGSFPGRANRRGIAADCADLQPYSTENYPLGTRARATGLVAGGSKVGGVAVQGFALIGLIPTLGGAAFALLVPMAVSAALVAFAGRETRGRSLRELEMAG